MRLDSTYDFFQSWNPMGLKGEADGGKWGKADNQLRLYIPSGSSLSSGKFLLWANYFSGEKKKKDGNHACFTVFMWELSAIF